jgi:hypothetical protein
MKALTPAQRQLLINTLVAAFEGCDCTCLRFETGDPSCLCNRCELWRLLIALDPVHAEIERQLSAKCEWKGKTA